MSPFLAGSLVFVTSAAVLVLEIVAGRLLAPYVGVTLETFTGIIGTVLAGISLGSWLGGRAADRLDPRSMLGPLVVAGGGTALAAPPLIDLLGAGLGSADPVSIVVLACAGFFAPAALLSAVTPTVVKIQLADLGRTGRVVGRLSALGTAGAIAGTFVTGFLLVATMPTRAIIWAVGGALVAIGVVLFALLHPHRNLPPPAAVAALVVAGLLTVAARGPCEYQTVYYCARVDVPEGDPSARVLILDRLRHSHVDLDDPTELGFTYTRTISDVLAHVAPPGEPLQALHIGGGGFTLPRYLLATRPGTRNVVLELDPALVELARTRLGLEPVDGIEVRTGDARLTLRDVAPGAFDVVIGDAFGGLSVPYHLTTTEFVEAIRRRLRPGGVYVLNLIDHPPLGFARAEAATLGEVFEHVAVLAPPQRLRGSQGGNFVLAASDGPLRLDSVLARNAARGDDEAAASGTELERFIDGAPALTDDFAPVDQLLNPYG